MPWPIVVHSFGSSASVLRRCSRMTAYSSESLSLVSGTAPAASNSVPRCTSSVASPPSSRIMLGPWPSGQRRICSVAHQYSSSVSPFHANTGMPAAAMAAAAWSWVEKMLHDAHRTWAPSAVNVSINTAVWIVMCSEPAMRAPARGCEGPNSARSAMRPGISSSASTISLRPKSASPRSATLKSTWSVIVIAVLRRFLSVDAAGWKSAGAERGLDVFENGDGAGVDSLVGGHVEAHEVADEDEVEQLGQLALALGPHLLDARHHLAQPLGDEVETPAHLRVLVVVAQVDEGHDLAGHVAVLAPALHLVVRQLGLAGPERRALGVLVDLVLPPQGGGGAEAVAAEDHRDGATDAAGDGGRFVVVAHQSVAPALQLTHGVVDPLAGAGEQTNLLQHDQRRDRHRTDACAWHGDVVGQADDRRAPTRRQLLELAARCHGHDVGALHRRLGGRLDRLLGVAREGDGEHQRLLAHEVRQRVRL